MGTKICKKIFQIMCFEYHFSLNWTVFELFTKTAIFNATKSESLSLTFLSNAL